MFPLRCSLGVLGWGAHVAGGGGASPGHFTHHNTPHTCTRAPRGSCWRRPVPPRPCGPCTSSRTITTQRTHTHTPCPYPYRTPPCPAHPLPIKRHTHTPCPYRTRTTHPAHTHLDPPTHPPTHPPVGPASPGRGVLRHQRVCRAVHCHAGLRHQDRPRAAGGAALRRHQHGEQPSHPPAPCPCPCPASPGPFPCARTRTHARTAHTQTRPFPFGLWPLGLGGKAARPGWACGPRGSCHVMSCRIASCALSAALPVASREWAGGGGDTHGQQEVGRQQQQGPLGVRATSSWRCLSPHACPLPRAACAPWPLPARATSRRRG